MDTKAKQIALSSLKTLANLSKIVPTVIANSQQEVVCPSIKNIGILLNKKMRVALSSQCSIRELLNDSGIVSDTELDHYISYAQNSVKTLNTMKLGSMSTLPYTISVYSSGVKIDKVGAKTGLKVSLDTNTVLAINKFRFISEFISYDLFDTNTYNSIMDRIIVIKAPDEDDEFPLYREVCISDFLLKVALIQEANISLDTLLANPDYILVLQYIHNKVSPLSHPLTINSVNDIIYSVYGVKSTFTEPSKVNEGYVGFNVDMKGMVVESDTELHSFLDAKKAVARQEKLNGNTCIAKVREKVFVITSSNDISLPYFNTGCFYASSKLLRSVGCVRLTSDINNLLIKGATHYAPFICKEANDFSIVASSSAKGGISSILAALGNALDFSQVDLVLDSPIYTETLTLENGDVVSGLYIEVELKITNAYTVENFQRYIGEDVPASLEESYSLYIGNKTDKVIGYDKEASRILSAEMMYRASQSNTSIIDVLCNAEIDREVCLKPAISTVTPGEFENISLSFGREISSMYMDSLIANPYNKVINPSIRAASKWLQGDVSDAIYMSIYTIKELVKELAIKHDVSISHKPSSNFNTLFIKDLVELLGLEVDGFVYIKELDVYMPIGKVLYGTLYIDIDTYKIDTQVTGVMKYLLSSVMYILVADMSNNLSEETYSLLLKTTGVHLKQFIQESLLSKKTAKLKVHGKYMTLLPGFWLENIHDVCLFSRDLYQPHFSYLEYTKVNMAKHPVLFLEAVAGFKCYKEIPGMDLDDELLSIYTNTIFVHPDYLLSLANDADGDLARISFDSFWLPLFSGQVLSSCSKDFHIDYIEGENDLGIDIHKAPKIKSFSHEEFYIAIKAASDAKANVAIFTDNLHKLQAGFRTSPVVAKTIKAMGRDKALVYIRDAIILTATLIQTDAMNAIKHDGGVTAGSSLTAVELRDEESIEIAKAAVIAYIEEHSFENFKENTSEALADLVVDIFYSIHSLESNKHKAFLMNQIERLTFKDSPNHLVLVQDMYGNDKLASRKLDLFGIYKDSWNVTGSKCLFAEFVYKFFGRI